MGGELHRGSITDKLSGFFDSGTTEGTVTGGSFAFTEADLRAIIVNWRHLETSYDDSLTNADRMARVEGPGDEFASAMQAGAANRSAESYRTYLEHNRDYCKTQAELFESALNDYLGVEHTNATDFDKTDTTGPSHGI